MVLIFRRGGGGSVTVAPAPEDPTIVNHQTVPTFSTLAPTAAKPGDTVLMQADGRVHRMKDGAVDASLPISWEVIDMALPRKYPSEGARLSRTGFTPRIGEVIGINGSTLLYSAAADSADDDPLNRASTGLPTGDIGVVTYGPTRPAKSEAGIIHYQLVGETPGVRWDPIEDRGSWINTGGGTLALNPNGTIDLTVSAKVSDPSITMVWSHGSQEFTESNTFGQLASVTTGVTGTIDQASLVTELMMTGIAEFPEGVLDFSLMEILDISNAGMGGSCPYLGSLHHLKTLDVSGNPGFTMDPSCTVDNVGLTVIS